MLTHPQCLGEAFNAAASHSQVRIAKLQWENSALVRETEVQQQMLERFEAKLGALLQERGVG
jgi:hypothetical protein